MNSKRIFSFGSLTLFVLIISLAFTSAAITGIVKEEEKPEQLFDITFDIEEALMLSSDKLTAVTTFESFGTAPTPVTLTYIITDEGGEIINTSKESIVVETENVVRKKFENLNLPLGKYILFLKTNYSDNIEDEFLKRFEIRSKISKSEGQLFDIKVQLDSKTIKIGDALSARVTFESFGSEPTPVTMSFAINDADGKEIYQEDDYEIVETEKVLVKEFRNIDFTEGEYTLVVNTLYNVDVEDEFREKFTVKKQTPYNLLFLASFGVNIFFLFAFAVMWRKFSKK